MPRANEIKRGQVVEYNGAPYMIRSIEKSSPTARGGNTLYRFKLLGVANGVRADATLKADDSLPEVDLTRRMCQYSYRDGDAVVVMDSEDYTPYTLSEDMVGEDAGYISDGLDGIQVLIVDETPIGLQLPQSVVMEVVETAPYIKGASATGRTKPAKLSSGIELPVPEYVTNGEKVRVNTETGEFMGRA